MDCTLWILLWPLILVVEISDAVCIKSCLICGETKNGLAVCWTTHWQKFSRFGLRADIRPAYILNWKRKAVVHVIPCNRAYDHREKLLPIFSCRYLGPRQHVLRYAPLDQVYERLSVFLHPQNRCSFSVLCKSTIHYNKFVWFGCFKSEISWAEDLARDIPWNSILDIYNWSSMIFDAQLFPQLQLVPQPERSLSHLSRLITIIDH